MLVAQKFGKDKKYGRWMNLTIAGVIQRFRRIEPGTFLMGSPEDEAGRDDGEGPQHEVTLTQGFWLADSACTQALWQAVMGNNPSHFQGDPRLPVENVSWHDVQGFLHKFQVLMKPGIEARLPTEAEWEYPCRAGTTTPFSFGPQIRPGQVNYYGKHPYTGGRRGLYREKTLPVKSLPPNLWGLYEMHGNVYEWCADGMRKYTKQAQTDPRGSVTGSFRVLRGGSYCADGGDVRSAFRLQFPQSNRLIEAGFRIALSETVQVQ